MPLKPAGDDVLLGGLEPITEVLRTPDAQFENLEGYEFAPHYLYSKAVITASGEPLRIHYVDEGPRDAKETVLLLHGTPDWCYIYREIIPPLVAAGQRVIAPDLVGFGRSDKPTSVRDYTYERHVEWMSEVVVQLNIRSATLFCQDWGGMIGLRVLARFPERFDRTVIGNTLLGTGSQYLQAALPERFIKWIEQISPTVGTGAEGTMPNWGNVLKLFVTSGKLTEADIKAYNAPFPDGKYMAGPRIFPRLLPLTDAHPTVAANKEAWRRLAQYKKPFATIWGPEDPACTVAVCQQFIDTIPGSAGQEHIKLPGAGHFVQEDDHEAVTKCILNHITNNPTTVPVH